jgi:Lysyl oxidase
VRSRMQARRSRIRVLGVCFALSALALVPAEPAVPTTAAAAPADLLPDLAMSYPTQIRIQATASGGRRLRMTTTIVNIGDGPFETASSRLAGQSAMGVNQRIYNTAGTYRVVETGARARYSGDGHDHWHVLDIARYEIHPLKSNGQALRRDAKVGFCFFDTNAYDLGLARAPQSPRYSAAGCGKRSSLFVKNGISVGWGDRYGWSLARQWIDITNLPAGEYYLKLTVDPLFQFQEIRHRNDCNWTHIRIPKTGTTVTVLGRGFACTLPGQTG